MSTMKTDITRETFEAMNIDTKLNVLFDFAACACTDAATAAKTAQELKDKLHKKAKFDSGIAGSLGFLGGLVGFFAQKIFFKG